jgi:hypothetical protein
MPAKVRCFPDFVRVIASECVQERTPVKGATAVALSVGAQENERLSA